MAISRMQQPRQMYGLGSIVKKAVRGVKKIAKSPLGKAAIIGGLGMYGTGTGLFGSSGMFSGAKGAGFLRGLGNLGARNMMNTGPLRGTSAGKGFFSRALTGGKNLFGGMTTGQKIFTGLAGTALAAPFLAGKPEEVVEEAEDQIDVDAIKQSARDFYMGTGGKNLSFMPKKEYVDQNFYAQQSAADGGRIGYSSGQLVSPSNDGSRPGYAGLQNIFGVNDGMPPRNTRNKFDFMFETGPMSDRAKEILSNMSEEDIKMLEEQGTLFDFIENVIKTPFIIRGGDTEYKANGGRIGYAMGGNTDDEDEVVRMTAGQRIMPRATFLNMGGGAGQAQAEQMLMAEFVKYKNQGGDLSFEQFVKAVMQQQEQPMMAADGGSVPDSTVPGYTTPAGYNKFDYTSGGVRVGKAEGGIMATDEASEMIDMGGMEKDYRDEGGFVAMGGEERADDVPARLSRNEFVFTADAVRNAGGGDIDRGSEVMQNLMDNLEQGGQVSEDSQGLGGGEEMMSEEIIEEPDGAQAMYEQQQALQSRMI